MTALLPLGYVPNIFAGLGNHMGGLYLPPGCLDRFWGSPITGVKHIVVAGDSVPQGTFTLVGGAAGGGMDCWPTRIARGLANELGGCVGAGHVGLQRSANVLGYSNSANEWNIAGSAPSQTINSAFAAAPYGGAWTPASGAANQLICTPQTITNPRQVTDATTTVNSQTITSASAAFTLAGDKGARVYGPGIPKDAFIIDVPNATTITINVAATASATNSLLGILGRNPVLGGIQQIDLLWQDGLGFTTQTSYSTDGGGTWNNTAAPTNPNPLVLRKQSIVTANPTTFRTRGANAAGTAQNGNGCCGIVLYNTTAPTAGVVVHNMSADGKRFDASSDQSGFLGSNASGGDPLKILDNLGNPGNSGSLMPALVIVNFSNDCDVASAQTMANLSTLMARVGGYADVLIIGPQEQDRTILGNTLAQQATYRATLKQWAQANGAGYIDLYEFFQQFIGTAGWQAAAAVNLLAVDHLHLTARSHFIVGSLVLRAMALMAG